jgi:excisionase family DNA binding protein
MVEVAMPVERITRGEIDKYKHGVMVASVLVTPDDAARILSCSPRKVYELVKTGRLSGYSENIRAKGLRILASELQAYVRSIRVDKDKWYE